MATKRTVQEYHPGNITRGDDAFRQTSEPPMSRRDVEMVSRPVLYSHDEKPIYRRIGFNPKARG